MTLDEAKVILDQAAHRSRSAARLTRSELMAILGMVYRIQLTPADELELMAHIIEHRKTEGANRAFVMDRGNPFTLPLRYVFPNVNDRTNISRYAGAMRELRSRGVEPEVFEDEVRKNGGIVDLYWNDRERTTKIMRRSKLQLNRNLEFVAGAPVTLTLLPQANGVFMVLEGPTGPSTTDSPAPRG